ncbi:MAG: Mur ligase domain-containing protein, partial [Puniceicoccales bacterium]
MNLPEQRFFFLGVGGMGMLPLALYVRQGGAQVAGMDDGLTPRAEALLRSAGVVLHDEILSDVDYSAVIISSAIRPGHPVLQRLCAGDSPPVVLRRGELLSRLAGERRFVAVAGSHGKTTTTALLAHLAMREGWSADFVIGGIPEEGLPPARNSGSEWLIAEVDESDGTIEG